MLPSTTGNGWPFEEESYVAWRFVLVITGLDEKELFASMGGGKEEEDETCGDKDERNNDPSPPGNCI